MQVLLAVLFLLSHFIPAHPRGLLLTGEPVILYPPPGEPLQGVVTIVGTTDLPGFTTAELAYAPAHGSTGWVLITRNGTPLISDSLALWDTTSLPDGDYNLRLRVNLADGTRRETFSSGVRIRNHSPVETSTPTPTATVPTPTSPPTHTPTPFPTLTAMPANPMSLSSAAIGNAVLYGSLGTILFFLSIGVYFWTKHR